ncbi:hypothetical protein [Micromonospora sp. NPDC005305]|uniref:hypothetical protein n=1 Tax=Micromonospora sp. NPDC005305 TaxID=3156875 RepID=UPI0033A0A37D
MTTFANTVSTVSGITDTPLPVPVPASSPHRPGVRIVTVVRFIERVDELIWKTARDARAVAAELADVAFESLELDARNQLSACARKARTRRGGPRRAGISGRPDAA